MKSKIELSRITIDIPKTDHKKLKALAAVLGKSMRELVTEQIEVLVHRATSFNKETKKAIKSVEDNKDLIEAKDIKDLFKKLGL